MSTQSLRQPALVTALVAVLLALVTFVALPASPPASAGQGAHARPHQRITVSVLPGIRQNGSRPAASRSARAVVAATVRPRTEGRPVLLQKWRGGRWRGVQRGHTSGRGNVVFWVPATAGGRPATYRVVALRRPGLPSVASRAARAHWGAPDFVDEFGGDALGPAWEHRIQFYNPWGGRACSKGDPRAVSVGGGVLQLSSVPDPDVTTPCTARDARGRILGDYPYRLNGHVSTQHSADFRYGVAAARMRFPKSLGQHASFWLQPRGLRPEGPTPWGAEVDVVEWYGARGSKDVMSSAVHAPMPDGSKRQIGGMIPRPSRFLATRSDSWWHDFHVFSVQWTPRSYIFRIAGHEVWRTNQGVSHVPEFLILSMLSSDFELPDVGMDPAPRTAEVDWVAFWQT
jgi:hypothetical protein